MVRCTMEIWKKNDSDFICNSEIFYSLAAVFKLEFQSSKAHIQLCNQVRKVYFPYNMYWYSEKLTIANHFA